MVDKSTGVSPQEANKKASRKNEANRKIVMWKFQTSNKRKMPDLSDNSFQLFSGRASRKRIYATTNPEIDSLILDSIVSASSGLSPRSVFTASRP